MSDFEGDPPVPAAAPGGPSAQEQDLATTLRYLGVRSLHAGRVESETFALLGSWSIQADGRVADGPAGLALDSLYPGGSALLVQLAKAPLDAIRTLELSPRSWLLAWHADARSAIVAEVQFDTPRHAISDIQVALVRFVCNASIRGHAPAPSGPPPGPAWPQVERRSRPMPMRNIGPLLLLMALAALCAAWLALVAAPSTREAAAVQQLELQRLREMAQATLVHDLSVSLATSDYGEVQDELTAFASLGYFQGAVVTNAAQRIVAMSGTVDSQRIGDGVTPAFVQRARVLELKLGSQTHGRVLFVPTPAAPDFGARAGHIVTGAALASLAALAALATFGWRQHRARLAAEQAGAAPFSLGAPLGARAAAAARRHWPWLVAAAAVAAWAFWTRP